ISKFCQENSVFFSNCLRSLHPLKVLLSLSDRFQVEFATLHVELQETKELVRARLGGGGDQGLLLLRSMRLDVPKFNEADPENEAVTKLPEEVQNARPREQPVAICDLHEVLQNGKAIRKVLVKWDNGSPEEATWECLSDFQNAYPDYNLGDK
nr:hypothetical protein [Tanacetum cinerariifolium]